MQQRTHTERISILFIRLTRVWPIIVILGYLFRVIGGLILFDRYYIPRGFASSFFEIMLIVLVSCSTFILSHPVPRLEYQFNTNKSTEIVIVLTSASICFAYSFYIWIRQDPILVLILNVIPIFTGFSMIPILFIWETLWLN